MDTQATGAHQVISTIPQHDWKQNSYKTALLRAIGDVALEFSSLPARGRGVAITLRLLAEYWVAYYWSFMHEECRVWQGPWDNYSRGCARTTEAVRRAIWAHAPTVLPSSLSDII